MPQFTARSADKYVLYEQSVQDPDAEVRFVRRVYKKMFRKNPTRLREDFCGTGAIACRWVKCSPDNVAVGIDLDPVPLEWGLRHNVKPLGKAKERVELIRGDVLEPRDDEMHVICANNFSYFIFKKRKKLKRYLEAVHHALADEGFLYLDIYGGPEAMIPQLEEWEYDEYTYVWDQDDYDPVTGDYRCFIHFEFPDGTRMKKAFRYDWRLWNLVEVRDLLKETGFSKVITYWEGTDEDGDGNGVFRPVKRGDDSAAWVAYVVARK